MNKSNLIKTILIIMLGIVLIGATSVFAADDADAADIFFNDDENESGIIVDDKDAKSSEAKDTAIKTTNNENNTLAVNNTNTANNTTNSTANNTSVYNNTNTPDSLSKAGLEDSIPTMVLIVVFGISSVYAYKKIRDYKNI